MRFTKIHIDGYGRFSDMEIEMTPGLQIIAGPNEHGKSTIRHFIGDMLYGQKRNATKRIYEDSNELRMPWKGTETYGGRLVYVLDNDDEIEVHRRFDKSNEKLTVFNRTLAQDITITRRKINARPLFFSLRRPPSSQPARKTFFFRSAPAFFPI